MSDIADVRKGDNVSVVIWSMIELSCALICASLPALRALLQKVPGFLSSGRKTTAVNTGSAVLDFSGRSRDRSSAGDLIPLKTYHEISDKKVTI